MIPDDDLSSSGFKDAEDVERSVFTQVLKIRRAHLIDVEEVSNYCSTAASLTG